MTQLQIQKNSYPLLSLLLPSKGRFIDLFLTLLFTNLKTSQPITVRFIVCANYNYLQRTVLKIFFFRSASFINERAHSVRGMIGAYNLAYDFAVKENANWVALWADDLLPATSFWLDDIFPEVTDPSFKFGILSSDEGGHKNKYGWNVFAGYPCAHFYIARTDALPGYLLNPSLAAYVGDNEIVIDRVKSNIPVTLLPIKVVHQPTINTTRKRNSQSYKNDLLKVYEIHPELMGKLDNIVLHGNVTTKDSNFIVDEGLSVIFTHETKGIPYAEFVSKAPVASHSLVV
ncbi:MAG: hypothetical protein CTY35_10725, partial [Methylotenera sp.]